MNDLQAAEERIATLESELAATKERNGKLQEMLLYYVDDDGGPPVTQADFEEAIRNPSKESLDDLIREFELTLKG